MAYTSNVYKAKDVSGKLPEYDAMRSRLQQKNTAEVGQQQDAMQRRFAAQGGLNTGSAIKQAQVIADQGAQRLDDANQQVNEQEAGARRALQAAEDQKAFQSQEADYGRQFTAGENQAGRDFQAGESRLGRDFQAGESEKQRGFQKGMFDEDMAFKKSAQDWQQKVQSRQLDQSDREYDTQLALGLSGMDDEQRGFYGDFSSSRKANPGASMSEHLAAIAKQKADQERDKEQSSKPTFTPNRRVW